MPLDALSNPQPSDTVSPSRETATRTVPGWAQVKVNDHVLRDDARVRQRPQSENTTLRTGRARADTGFIPDLVQESRERRVVALPISPREAPREITLQEWEGQVQDVGKTYFSARLVDLTAGDTEETEEVKLPLSDITESDQMLLVPGAVFRWIIGYRYVDSVKERFARVVVRRLPVWTEHEIREADKEAMELHHVLFGNDSGGAASAKSD
jgi:hypothetical protein